ncbi:hypothetical protein [Nostoc punctiforme]|uniref:hypothetical protein n=1 Tax=Nostoc punctiforme TaxID=272131 RepID=UPI0006938C26|nr:hypothetical protein [Nostoc punctiforme]
MLTNIGSTHIKPSVASNLSASLNPAIRLYTRLTTTAIITGNVSILYLKFVLSFVDNCRSGLKLDGSSYVYICASICSIAGAGTWICLLRSGLLSFLIRGVAILTTPFVFLSTPLIYLLLFTVSLS